jgi:hypothetical protein
LFNAAIAAKNIKISTEAYLETLTSQSLPITASKLQELQVEIMTQVSIELPEKIYSVLHCNPDELDKELNDLRQSRRLIG